MIEKLDEGIKKLGFSLDEKQIEQIEKYISEIMKFNQTYNLMKADSEEELAVHHILDSLAGSKTIQSLVLELEKSRGKGKVVIGDIGSGGGCPGIPLAISNPETNFILVERMEKRCAFLEMAIAECGLKNVKVNPVQADKVEKSSLDIAVHRAFHPMDKKILKLLLAMLKKDGYICAFKAREEKIKAEMEEVNSIVKSYEQKKLVVPFMEDYERNLVIIQKKNCTLN